MLLKVPVFTIIIITVSTILTFSRSDLLDDAAALLESTSDKVEDVINNFEFSQKTTDPTNITYYLYYVDPTSNNIKAREVSWDQVKSGKFTVDSTIPFFMYIPGWKTSPILNYIKDIAQNLMFKLDCTVLVANWTIFSQQNYLTSSRMTYTVGRTIGDFITALVKGNTRINLIGHSLGAHVAGSAGQQIYNSTIIKVYNIWGLDPAGVFYEFLGMDVDKKYRLDAGDALFVEVIHTDPGILGSSVPTGDVDFFTNGFYSVEDDCQGINPINDVKCSHSDAYLYFNWSINARTYEAVKCPGLTKFPRGACSSSSKALMGFGTDRSARGTYYLKRD